ncbi:MAG: L-fucose/L-arabinose isomerase family protein [Anaerolineaceae bacterium]|nr:L-fucose/L-arabinose isomerase family protein [Anaerolineaceae bacterium]
MADTPPMIGFVPIARPTFDVPLAQEMTQQVVRQLAKAGFSLVGTPDLVMDAAAVETRIRLFDVNPPDLLLVLQASFADSSMAKALAERVDAPLLLWALPEPRVGGRLRLNSFCGINLAGHALRRAGLAYETIYATPDDPSALAKVGVLAKAAAVRRRLRGTRIGRVGENPAGFETCIPNQPALKAQLGLEVVGIDLQQVFAGVRAQPQEKIAALAQTVRQQVAGVDDMDAVATNGTLGAFLTLEHIAEKEQLDGLAVRCWPEFFTDLGCSACGAMSMLSNKLLPCSCESDVNGTITQLILQWISGEPAFGSDLVSFDTAEDVAILWHCGLAPLSMADPSVQPRATIHSNRRMPLLMEFPLKPGRVTLARLSEATGEFRLVIAGGEMIQAPPSFTGTTGTLRFDSGAAVVMDAILREGLEHHLSLTYGDHRETLLALAKMLDLPVLEL